MTVFGLWSNFWDHVGSNFGFLVIFCGDSSHFTPRDTLGVMFTKNNCKKCKGCPHRENRGDASAAEPFFLLNYFLYVFCIAFLVDLGSFLDRFLDTLDTIFVFFFLQFQADVTF